MSRFRLTLFGTLGFGLAGIALVSYELYVLKAPGPGLLANSVVLLGIQIICGAFAGGVLAAGGLSGGRAATGFALGFLLAWFGLLFSEMGIPGEGIHLYLERAVDYAFAFGLLGLIGGLFTSPRHSWRCVLACALAGAIAGALPISTRARHLCAYTISGALTGLAFDLGRWGRES